MFPSRSFCALLFLLVAAGCSDSIPPVTPPPVTTVVPTYHYQFLAEHIHFLGDSGKYIAWFRYLGDSTYAQHVALLAFFYGPPDSMKFEQDVKLAKSIDSLSEILVSLEPDTAVTSPSAPLMKGGWQSGSAFLSTVPLFGDLTTSSATVTFATRSADTSRAQHEFYLMNLNGSDPVPSTINLPIAPASWHYSLWVTDSNYEPKHIFYYGSFRNPAGPDSDTSAGEYPYPGGYQPPLLSDPGAEILLSLTPDWRLAHGRPQALVPLNVLQLRLKRFLHYREAIPMTNVANSGLPHGFFLLKKK
jgi:hypothetical protein